MPSGAVNSCIPAVCVYHVWWLLLPCSMCARVLRAAGKQEGVQHLWGIAARPIAVLRSVTAVVLPVAAAAWGYQSWKAAVDGWYNEVEQYNFAQPGFSGATGELMGCNSPSRQCLAAAAVGEPTVLPPGLDCNTADSSTGVKLERPDFP